MWAPPLPWESLSIRQSEGVQQYPTRGMPAAPTLRMKPQISSTSASRPDLPSTSWSLGDGRLALADPDHVPAGRYARAALESLGVWQAVGPSSVRAPHVRAALALIERGETPLGIVYESDVRVCPTCQVVGILPADSHPPIRYPLALVAGQAGEAARAFHAFLMSETAAGIFRRHGFAVR